MRAVTYSRFGPAADVLSLEQIDAPRPAPGEVLVRLAYSGVNPSDAKARAGTRPGVTKPAFDTIIPHSDGSGEITAIGDGADPDRIGERVWIWNGQWQRPFGTAAELIALPADQAVPLPKGISLQAGATLGIPGLTAAQTVFGGGDVTGQTVLVSGGAGAVGHVAVQLAKAGGARVIATGSANRFDHIRAAGADHVLDYADPDLASQIAAIGPVHRAIEVEFGANAALLAEIMAPLGTIAAYGSAKDMAPSLPFGPFLFKALKLDISLIYILPKPARDAAIARLHDALTKGALVPAIDSIQPLEACAQAQDATLTPGRAGAILLEL